MRKIEHSAVDKRRVLMVVRWPVGGIRTFIRYVYRNFDPKRWQFTILASELDEMQILMDDLDGLDVVFAPVEGMPNDGSSGFWKLFRCVATQLIRGDYDLVHSHGFISGMCTAIPSFLSRTPHLMTSHDIINENQFEGTIGKVKKQVMGLFFGLIDVIHSVSYDAHENLLAHFPALGRLKGKSIVIPNGIEVHRFENSSPRDLRGELDLRDDVFLVGFLGRFMAQKGFRYLVDAIDILNNRPGLPKRPLVLAFGDGGFVREEQQVIKNRGLDKYFRFMPFAPNVAGTIKGLDLVAMPSLWEACPLQPMEALVCGTPFIGTDCPGLREVLQGTPALLVPKGNAVRLAQAIQEMMQRSSKDEFLSFRKVASERFDVAKTRKSILDLYEFLTRSNS